MTKTLTEQWREGTLPEGCYYILDKNGHVRTERTCFYSHTDEQCFSFISNKDIEEVLAPVPSYQEFVQQRDFVKDHLKVLIENMNLKRKLAIATKALKEYDNKLNWDIRGVSFMKYNKGFTLARKALKEMEGVK